MRQRDYIACSIRERVTTIERTLSKAATWLKETLDYEFGNDGYLVQALTHRSASGENNERLEFLGDAVLDSVVSEVVFRLRPNSDEGELSRLRSFLVKDSSLAELGESLGIGVHIILGPGEKKTGGHRRGSILADALEAIIGAVYLDGGYQAAITLISRAYGERLQTLPDADDLRDPKTQLQEFLQARKLALPDYEIQNISGKAHRQHFEVVCTIPEVDKSSAGEGGSRRDAEQEAARSMLAILEVESK